MFTALKSAALLSSLALVLSAAGRANAAPSTEGAQAEPPPVIQLVGLVPGTGQAILWDEGRHVYLMVKAGEEIRGARVNKVSAEGVLISQGKISLVVPLAPSPFLLREYASMQGEAGPPAVIVAPRQYQQPPPFLGNKPAAPPSEKKTSPAAKLQPASSRTIPAKQNKQPTSTPPEITPAVEAASSPAAPPSTEASRSPAPVPMATVPVSLSLGQLRAEVSNCLASRASCLASLSPTQGILLLGIAEGSLPHRLGLRSGDTLLSLGGQVLRNRDAAADAYLNLVPGSEVELVVLRQGGGQQTVRVRVGV